MQFFLKSEVSKRELESGPAIMDMVWHIACGLVAQDLRDGEREGIWASVCS